jgi:chromate transporter
VGPIAHLGYFREEFVARRGWIDDRGYADLVALCQFLPGTGIQPRSASHLGLQRAGPAGALAAWRGVYLAFRPAAAAVRARSGGRFQARSASGVLHGLKLGGRVAIVAQAVWGDGAHALPPTAHARRSRSPPS